LQEITR
jgi:hypothetical protein